MRSLIVYDGPKSADEVCDLVAAIDWPPWSELRADAVGSSLGRTWPAPVYQRVVTPRHGWPWRG